ncbi:MAG: hypothetical protein U0792_08340 [Gemmataceae bacterium]
MLYQPADDDRPRQHPHFSRDRRVTDPLVVAGGPGAQNPELLAPFVDLFVIGDGEESLPWVMEKWMSLKESYRPARRGRTSLTPDWKCSRNS